MSVQFHKTVIAHRGAKAYAPENTMSAFSKAVDMGSSWIEFDVCASQCGTPVVFHDASLERLTNHVGKVKDCTYAYLRQLDVGSAFSSVFRGAKIPSLEEVLSTFADVPLGFNIEIKSSHSDPVLAQSIVSLIATYCDRWPQTILVSSQHLGMLTLMRQYAPELSLAYVASSWQPRMIPHLEVLNCVGCSIKNKHINAARVKLFHESGMQVLVYTVNKRSEAEHLFEDGVDAIFSDYPDIMSS